MMQRIIKKLNIKNSVIVADAMHCQQETAKIICQGEADYALQIKDTQNLLTKKQ